MPVRRVQADLFTQPTTVSSSGACTSSTLTPPVKARRHDTASGRFPCLMCPYFCASLDRPAMQLAAQGCACSSG